MVVIEVEGWWNLGFLVLKLLKKKICIFVMTVVLIDESYFGWYLLNRIHND